MASEKWDADHGTLPPGGSSWSEFEELYRNTHDKVITYVTRQGFSQADANDIVSVAFMNLWRFWLENGRPNEPTPYLYKILKRRMIDHVRRASRDAARVVDFDSPDAPAEPVSPVQEFAASIEPETAYLQAIASLPKRQRAVLQLHGIGLKDTEIAAAVDHSGDLAPPSAVPEKAARALTAEARQGHEQDQGVARIADAGVELPLEFVAYHLSHHEAFHTYAWAHFHVPAVVEDVVHTAYMEILARWTELLTSKNLEQSAWAILRNAVDDRLKAEDRSRAAIAKEPIAQALNKALVTARDKLQTMESSSGLYEAIAELPDRQFEVIVLRYVLGYPTSKTAWYIGIDERTVGHHLRRAKERLRVRLGMPDKR